MEPEVAGHSGPRALLPVVQGSPARTPRWSDGAGRCYVTPISQDSPIQRGGCMNQKPTLHVSKSKSYHPALRLRLGPNGNQSLAVVSGAWIPFWKGVERKGAPGCWNMSNGLGRALATNESVPLHTPPRSRLRVNWGPAASFEAVAMMLRAASERLGPSGTSVRPETRQTLLSSERIVEVGGLTM